MFGRTIAIAFSVLASCTLDAAPGITPLIRFKPGQNAYVSDATSDAQGHVYLCGFVRRGASFPGQVVVRGSGGTNDLDAFVMKLGPNGAPLTTLVLSGNDFEIAERITTDSQGNIVIYGLSGSMNFPTVNALFSTPASASSSFLCKLDPSLTNIIFSTFLNGAGTYAMAVDQEDNILLAGTAFGGPGLFPNLTLQESDPFFLKLAPNGTNILYATLLSVNSGYVTALAVDSSGVAHAVGNSSASDFPLVNALLPFKPGLEGYSSAFLVRIGATGTLLSSTFIGGNCYEEPTAVAVNAAGEIYVAGSGVSDVIPATEQYGTAPCGTSRKGFLLKLGAGATNVLYSKLFALSGNDHLSAVVVTPDDAAIVGGSSSYDSGVPFLARVSPDGSATSYAPRDCGTTAGIAHLALHPSGQILISGVEDNTRDLTSDLGSYVALADLGRLAPEPELHIVSPKPYAVIGTNQPLQLVALAIGFAQEIESVTFHDGKTPLGTATNAPYSIQVPSLSRGTHNITAVAHTTQGRVSSCALVVKARTPRNDNFANRIRLTGQRVSVRGDTAGATIEPGENEYPNTQSVWYSWRAPRDGAFEFSLSQDSRVGATVMQGTTLSALQALVYFRPQSPGALHCRRGQTYHIRLAQYYAPGYFRMQIRAVTAPQNDNFENARPLSGAPASAPGDFTHATRELGEPGYADTIWYSWIAPASGLYLASTTNSAAYLDVYTGSVVTNLVSHGQRIYGLIEGSAFYAEAGEKYFVSASRGNVPLQFTLSIEPYSPPLNDAFENRIAIPANTLSATGSCIGATAQSGEPAALSSPTRSVWFKWIAPSSFAYRVSASVPYPPPQPSPYGSVPLGPRANHETLKVYRGDALDALAPLNITYYGLDGELWRAEAGVEYQIAVSGGAAYFTLEIEPVPPPSNDDFANAQLLNGFTRAGGTLDAASVEPEEPSHNGFSSSKASVWYRWVAPSNGLFKVETYESVRIYTGTTLSTLVPAPVAGAGNLFRAEAGTVFSLAVFDPYGFLPRHFDVRVRPAFPPPNDDFANATPLEGFNFIFAARTHDATSEPAESFDQRSSVWFTWTAPTNGSFALRCTNIYGATLSVYTGDSLSNLDFVVEAYSSPVEFNARAGEQFYFSVDGATGDPSRDFLVELFRYPAVPNDHFTNAIVLTGTNVSISVTNLGASIETNEPTLGDVTAQRTVWYSWTAPKSGRASFIATGDDFLEFVNIFTGDTLATLVAVRPLETHSRFNVPVEAGVTYRISIDGYTYYGSGVCQFEIRYATPPPNDDFAQRLSLTNGVGVGTIEAASRETSEPVYDLDPLVSSVWWTFTATSNGVHYLQLSSPDATPRIGVYRGNTLESLDAILTDQFYYARFTATAGVPVVIQLAGLSGTFSTYTLTVQHEPAPTNDLFASRVAFTNSVRGTLRGAMVEPGEPNHQTGAGSSVWWNWTAPRTGAYEIKIVEADYRYDFYGIAGRLFTGTNLAQLQEVTPAPIGYYSRWVHAEEGTTYAVSVDAPQLTYEKFLLSMIYHEAPANDLFTNRITLAGAGLSVTGSTLYATSEPGEFGGNNHSLWYSWTPASAGTAVFQTDYSTQLDIFLGNSVTNLVRLGGTSVHATSVTRPVSPGEDYKLRIVPAYAITFNGPHTFTLTVTNIPAALASSPPLQLGARALLITLPAERSVIETSTNLADWQPWRTNQAGTRMSVPIGEEPQRFFRVR